jgi:hypothetical protein
MPNWQAACSRREQKCIDIHCKQENMGNAMQEDNKSKGHRILPISRRRFVQGLAACPIGSGLSGLDTGVRLRYEISRKFSPYIGFADSGNMATRPAIRVKRGETRSDHRFVLGLRLWF